METKLNINAIPNGSIGKDKFTEEVSNILDYINNKQEIIDNINNEPEFIEFADLIAKAERGELEVGKEYRYPYTLITHQETAEDQTWRFCRSAGHYFDIVTKALTPSILCEKVRIMYNENDSYFKDWNANVGAWQVWINMQRPSQVDIGYMPSFEDFINTKGQIYKMIDENGIECNYDFKNMLFKCCIEADYIGTDAETEFKATISYDDAVDWGTETDPFYLYTFSTYIGQENWKDNIIDASLFDRKYSEEGFVAFNDIKIRLYFANEYSTCLIKVLSTVTDDGYVGSNNIINNLDINNSAKSVSICCFGDLQNINITNSSRVYLCNCNDCGINSSNCILSNTSSSKINYSYHVGLSECDYCEINNSNYVYVFDSVYNKYTEVRSDADYLDYQDQFLPYIMSPDEWCNMYGLQNCDFKGIPLSFVVNSSNIKIHNVANSNTNGYLQIHKCYDVEINNLYLNYTGEEDEFMLSLNKCYNMIFGNDNMLQFEKYSYINNCHSVNIGNNNSIELRVETETENILGMNNIDFITIGNNNSGVFISNCSNINIGDSNDEVFIVGRNKGISNLTVKNYSSIYLSDLTSSNKEVHINDMVIENNCYVQLCDLDKYLVENNLSNSIEFSNIHIKNGSNFKMFTNPQDQYRMSKILNIEVDASNIYNLVIDVETVKNIKFINSEINSIYFYSGISKTIKNIVFKDCIISDLISVDDVTTNGLYTVTMDEDDYVALKDFILDGYPIQYIVDGKTYSMSEIL